MVSDTALALWYNNQEVSTKGNGSKVKRMVEANTMMQR